MPVALTGTISWVLGDNTYLIKAQLPTGTTKRRGNLYSLTPSLSISLSKTFPSPLTPSTLYIYLGECFVLIYGGIDLNCLVSGHH